MTNHDIDFDRLTDREWAMRTDRHALQAMKTAGELHTRVNEIAAQHNDIIRALADLGETVELLSAIILQNA